MSKPAWLQTGEMQERHEKLDKSYSKGWLRRNKPNILIKKKGIPVEITEKVKTRVEPFQHMFKEKRVPTGETAYFPVKQKFNLNLTYKGVTVGMIGKKKGQTDVLIKPPINTSIPSRRRNKRHPGKWVSLETKSKRGRR